MSDWLHCTGVIYTDNLGSCELSERLAKDERCPYDEAYAQILHPATNSYTTNNANDVLQKIINPSGIGDSEKHLIIRMNDINSDFDVYTDMEIEIPDLPSGSEGPLEIDVSLKSTHPGEYQGMYFTEWIITIKGTLRDRGSDEDIEKLKTWWTFMKEIFSNTHAVLHITTTYQSGKDIFLS